MPAFAQDAVVTLAAIGAVWLIVRRIVRRPRPPEQSCRACPLASNLTSGEMAIRRQLVAARRGDGALALGERHAVRRALRRMDLAIYRARHNRIRRAGGA